MAKNVTAVTVSISPLRETVDPGDSANFICTVTVNRTIDPSYVVRWFKAGAHRHITTDNSVYDDTYYECDDNEGVCSYFLRMLNCTEEMNLSAYQCAVSVTKKDHYSRAALLTVKPAATSTPPTATTSAASTATAEFILPTFVTVLIALYCVL